MHRSSAQKVLSPAEVSRIKAKTRPDGLEEGVPWERWILRNFSKMRVHARLSFIVTTNLPSFVTLIRCFIGRSKPLGRLEEFGQAVFHKEVKIQRSLGTPSFVFRRLVNALQSKD